MPPFWKKDNAEITQENESHPTMTKMRILIIKLKHIGDTLLMTPTFRWLREEYPDAVIDVVIRSGTESVLAGNPDISNIFLVARPETKKRSWHDLKSNIQTAFRIVTSPRYDYAFDLSNSDRAKQLVLLSRARVRGINDWNAKLGIKRKLFNAFSSFPWRDCHQVEKDFRTVTDIMGRQAKPGPLVMLSLTAPSEIENALPDIQLDKPYAVFHPTSRWIYKQWDHHRWIELVTWLQKEMGLQVVLSVGPDTREIEYASRIVQACNGVVSTGGQLTLPQIAALLQKAHLFVGIDTAVMHLSAAMQAPTIALFGANNENNWKPWRCHHRLVLGDCSCKRNNKLICDKSRIFPCMESISVEQVIEDIEMLLGD